MSIKESVKEYIGKKSQDVLFSENQVCALSEWDLLGLTPWVFWSKIFTRRPSQCLLSFVCDLSPRFVPQGWLYTFYWSLPVLKGRFDCVKLFDFFRGWILIRWTSNLSRFVPNSMQILTWNFRKNLFWENFSRKPRLSSTKTCEILPYFVQFLFSVRNALKNFTQVLSYVVCAQVRRHVHKGITKRIYGEEKTGRFVFWKSVLFTLGLGLTTPYSLGVWCKFFTRRPSQCLLSFGSDLSPRFVPQDLQ